MTTTLAPVRRKRAIPPTEVVVDWQPLSKATPRQLLARERGLSLLLQPLVPAAVTP